MSYSPATRPTFYFIGVTTGQSSIMKVLPVWAEYLELGDVEIKGIHNCGLNLFKTNFIDNHVEQVVYIDIS